MIASRRGDQLQQKSLLNTGGRGIECHHHTCEAVLYGIAGYPRA